MSSDSKISLNNKASDQKYIPRLTIVSHKTNSTQQMSELFTRRYPKRKQPGCKKCADAAMVISDQKL